MTTIIFDLGGVLLGQSRAGFIRSLGLGALFTYAIFDRKALWKFPAALQDLVFAVCGQFKIEKDPCIKPSFTPAGVELPYILCAYQAGRIYSADILEQLPHVLHVCRKKGYFVSHRQELLVKRAIEGIFNAELIAKYIYPIRPTVSLLRRLAHIKNPDGSKKYRILALSNWDKESFAFVKQRFAHQFSYFDGIIISGDVGTIKPNQAIFECAMKLYNLQPEDCIFIDDQNENIIAAKAFGIERSIHFTRTHALRRKLEALHILPKS